MVYRCHYCCSYSRDLRNHSTALHHVGCCSFVCMSVYIYGKQYWFHNTSHNRLTDNYYLKNSLRTQGYWKICNYLDQLSSYLSQDSPEKTTLCQNRYSTHDGSGYKCPPITSSPVYWRRYEWIIYKFWCSHTYDETLILSLERIFKALIFLIYRESLGNLLAFFRFSYRISRIFRDLLARIDLSQ